MEGSSIPLAEYFWIAGVEAISYDDGLLSNLPVESTIAEDGEPEDVTAKGQRRPSAARHSRQNSANRLSKISFDGRFSINTTLEDIDGNTRSNRSSATIRAITEPNTNGSVANDGGEVAQPSQPTLPNQGGQRIPKMGDFDFDKALFKFAAERENFLEDLSFSAGAKTQTRAPMVNPRAERIRAEEGDASGRVSPLKSIRGSIRRKISFRDMNSMRKQPTPNRQGGPTAAGALSPVSR